MKTQTPCLLDVQPAAPRLRRISPTLSRRPATGLSDERALPTARLKVLSDAYYYDGSVSLLSPRTLETRRLFIRNLLWFLEHCGYDSCGTPQLREFFYYLAHGHQERGGRFGHAHLNRPLRPITIKDYYVCLRAFFAWIAASGETERTPFAAIARPQVQKETKPPLSPDQILQLFHAATRSSNSLRDKALLYWLLDTGCRASEIVGICVQDLDLRDQSCRVLGKGNKYRTVYFGSATARALHSYLQSSRLAREAAPVACAETPLFLSCRGARPLTRSGLLQLVERLATLAGIRGSCSPHAFRRTFAVQTLRNGANVFSVQAMLGHSDLQMTQRYCALAQADVEAQHRLYGPADNLALAG